MNRQQENKHDWRCRQTVFTNNKKNMLKTKQHPTFCLFYFIRPPPSGPKPPPQYKS